MEVKIGGEEVVDELRKGVSQSMVGGSFMSQARVDV